MLFLNNKTVKILPQYSSLHPCLLRDVAMLRIAQEALTFDDVLLVPAHSKVLPHTADLKTKLTRKINLNVPMISASMDTVTEARLAITLAQEGGLGFIHKNMTIAEQAKNVSKVKKYESGIVSDPVTVSLNFTIEEVMHKANRYSSLGAIKLKEKNIKGSIFKAFLSTMLFGGIAFFVII